VAVVNKSGSKRDDLMGIVTGLGIGCRSLEAG